MKRSYHSRLTQMLREAEAACAESSVTGKPLAEVSAERATLAASRRGFLQSAGSLLAATALADWVPVRARAGSTPRIVIVGAGLAGLRCAHRLWTERQTPSTVYEWNDRLGGRVNTLRNFFSDGQIAEQHAEFISSEHISMRRLAHRLGLKLENAQLGPGNDVYWFNGGYYTQTQLNQDWQEFGWKLFREAVQRAPFPTLYNQYNRVAYQWDHVSVVDWIEANVPGGMDCPFGRLCYQVVLSEYGGPAEQQSALNLLYILGYDGSRSSGYQPKNSPVLSGTDEKYHIHGGNDQIIQGMADELPAGTIQSGQRLVGLKLNSDGSYTCTFESTGAIKEVLADHVVLTIPFTTLRQVDLSRAGLSARKMRAIRHLQLGTNIKLHLQFKSKVWVDHGLSGTTYADNGADTIWDCTSYQTGKTGILVDFIGGRQGLELPARYGLRSDEQVAPTALASDTLAALEPIFPGATAAFNGLAYCSAGLLDPRAGGSWSQYNVGQYTDFGGYEGVREGNLHFAGEHTSIDFQGFMEGAVTSGERVAGEI